MQRIPDKLYRFRSVSYENIHINKNNELEGNIYFPYSYELNDPLESRPFVHFDLEDIEIIYVLYKNVCVYYIYNILDIKNFPPVKYINNIKNIIYSIY